MASSPKTECPLLKAMVTSFGSEQPIKRKGWFLKPTPQIPTFISHNSFPALSRCESLPFTTGEAPKSGFRWWADPPAQWGKWVEKLRPIYRELWKKVGIFDAINASIYKFRKDPSLLWGLIRLWCGETNTFLFQWGEATVTLEDVMILGGFSVIGEPVRVCKSLDGDLKELEAELIKQLRKIDGRGNNHHSWMKHYMEEREGDELEHASFLSLWLSRFVFPANPRNVLHSFVFPIAVRLARGVRIALAPAVLASLYRNLRELKIMFQWRPYVASLDNWCKPSFYEGNGEWVIGNAADDEELVSFAWCLRPSQLLGLECIEQYLPHRVAMQFGFDLDVPVSVPRSTLGWEIAWRTYEINTKSVKFYVPSQLHEPSVTSKYSIWWKNFRSFLKRKMKRVKSRPFPSTNNRNGQALLDNMDSNRIGKEEEICLLEKGEEMVSFLGSKNPIIRNAIFLKPISRISTSESSNHPFVSSQYKPTLINLKEVHTILFNGWFNPNRQWRQWVDKLKPIYNDLWQKVGIFDAIKSSIYTFKRDRSSLLGVIRFWSEETNTFIFPWGEATITLEDVMILGGYPVLGEPIRVTRPLDDELRLLESKMIEERKKFSSTKSKKASHCEWIAYYIKGNGEELEHIAFLSLWLSRFVIPSPPIDAIGKHVLPIAIRLARGVRIALAPAVLATVYRDLSAMRYNLIKNPNAPISVFTPLQILQLWLWERFLRLRPKSPGFVTSDEPRAARWHGVVMGKKLKFSFVMSVFESPNEFQWRPYTTPLDNWRKPSYYKDNGEWIYGNAVNIEEFGLFAYCLRACELVGLDCIEQYLPHRVALQFGLDQGIPKYVPRACSTWQLAWKTYAISDKNVKFYVPPRLFESDITLQYSIWWEKHEVFSKKKSKRKRKHESLPSQKMKKKKLRNLYDERVTNSLNKDNHHTGGRKTDIPIAINLFLKHSESKVSQSENKGEIGKGIASNPLVIHEGSVGDSWGNNLVEFGYDSITDLEDVDITEEKSEIEEMRNNDVKDTDFAENMEIKMLREKIASIQARITELESMAEVHT